MHTHAYYISPSRCYSVYIQHDHDDLDRDHDASVQLQLQLQRRTHAHACKQADDITVAKIRRFFAKTRAKRAQKICEKGPSPSRLPKNLRNFARILTLDANNMRKPIYRQFLDALVLVKNGFIQSHVALKPPDIRAILIYSTPAGACTNKFFFFFFFWF